MIRIYPGDVLRIKANEQFYYVYLLDKISFFGGQLSFALHYTSKEPQDAEVILGVEPVGFYSICDFIWAKREDRIERIAKKLVMSELNDSLLYFKQTFSDCIPDKDGNRYSKPMRWFISDRDGNEIKDTYELTPEEEKYPLRRRIDDTSLVDLIDRRWKPENDPRIKKTQPDRSPQLPSSLGQSGDD